MCFLQSILFFVNLRHIILKEGPHKTMFYSPWSSSLGLILITYKITQPYKHLFELVYSPL